MLFAPNPVDAGLEEVIDAVQSNLLKLDPTTDEFAVTVKQLAKLHKIRSSSKKSGNVDLNSLVGVAGNLAGIWSILGYERVHVVTSKALSFVLKSKF